MPLSGNVRFFRVKLPALSLQSIVTQSKYKAFDVNIVAIGETLSKIWYELHSILTRQRAEIIAFRISQAQLPIGGNDVAERSKINNSLISKIDHANEFEVWLDKRPRSWSTNTAVGNQLEGNRVEIQLQNDLYRHEFDMETMLNRHGNQNIYSEARYKHALQWDRKIAMLVHMWRLYELVEQSDNNNNNVDDDKNVSLIMNYVHVDTMKILRQPSENSVPLRRDLARHAAVCMNAFIDATDDEGLAHLGGLLILYMRTMDESAVNDSRYAELRKVFASFEPALLALKWRHVEQMCSALNALAQMTKIAQNATVISYLSDYMKEELKMRVVPTPIPPESVLYVARDVPPSSASSFNRLTSNVFHDQSKRDKIARYELRFVDPSVDFTKSQSLLRPTSITWQPPLALGPMILPTSHLSRVVSSNGICYDLFSRLDDNKWRGRVCYLPQETRYSISTESLNHQSKEIQAKRYVDHMWYEADVTSIVLLDGTRYLLADNTRSTNPMIVSVYRVPMNSRCNPIVKRRTITARNRSGLSVNEHIAAEIFPQGRYNTNGASDKSSSAVLEKAIPYDEFDVHYDGFVHYNEVNSDKHTITVQTLLDQSDSLASTNNRALAHEYAFDEHNAILLKVSSGRRVIVCVRHKRQQPIATQDIYLRNSTAANDGTEVPECIDRGMQHKWLQLLDLGERTFRYSFKDKRARCTTRPRFFSEIKVEMQPLAVFDYAVCDNRFTITPPTT